MGGWQAAVSAGAAALQAASLMTAELAASCKQPGDTQVELSGVPSCV